MSTAMQTILVPLDQSQFAEEAVGVGAAIARASQGSLELVLAHPTSAYAGELVQGMTENKTPEETAYVRAIAADLNSNGLRANGVVQAGDPTDVICRRAKDVKADLIVMTSHGRTGLKRAWLGSVTDAVVRTSHTPVLVLRSTAPTHDGAMPITADFQRILIPLDGSDASASIIGVAAALAKQHNATLILLRIVVPIPFVIVDPQVPAYPSAIPDEEATRQAAEQEREALSALAKDVRETYGAPVESVLIIAPDPGTVILEVARTHHADLVAMTTHGRGGATRMVLGSTTDHVLRDGTLPMLVCAPR